MKTTIIAGFVIEPITPVADGIQSFKIMTVDRSKDATKHYRTIASEFAKKTGFKVNDTHFRPDKDDIRFVFDCNIPNEPEFQFHPDESAPDFDGLSKWFKLESDFLHGLHDKLTNKDDMFMACQYFADGILAYDIATGDAPIDIPTIRDNYIAGLEKQRASAAKIAAYYNSCFTVVVTHDGGKFREIAFIKDGRLVAFGQFTRDHRGGIYAANNDVEKIPNWNPHECVGKFRSLNRQAYKQIKRLCTNEPPETFQFDQRTIRKSR